MVHFYLIVNCLHIKLMIGLVSLFNGISMFVGYFNAKAVHLEEQQ